MRKSFQNTVICNLKQQYPVSQWFFSNNTKVEIKSLQSAVIKPEEVWGTKILEENRISISVSFYFFMIAKVIFGCP